MVLRHSRWLRCCYRRRHARRCAFAFWQQRERDMNDEKGRPMTYWGGKPAPESSEQQICPECGAGPDTQCDLRFLAANCPRNMRSEEKQHEAPINLQRELRRNYLGAVPVHVVRVMELAAGRIDLLERELASAKRDADHFFQLSGRYLEELSAASAIGRRDLEDALNIGLAALGYFNTEQTDKHWNEQERVLREIEKKMHRADKSNA